MKSKPAITALLLGLLGLLIGIVVHAQGTHEKETAGHQKRHSVTEGIPAEHYLNVDVKLHDLELLTQDGQRVKFKSELIAERLVAMTFVYTSCTTICPVYNAIFTRLQDLLGERLGKDVILVTMTLDPIRDIPQRMKKEAAKFAAKPGWVYLTGKKQNVDQVLRGLDAYFPDFTQHPPMALVGDGKTGAWKRVNGFPRPEQLLALIDELKAHRE